MNRIHTHREPNFGRSGNNLERLILLRQLSRPPWPRLGWRKASGSFPRGSLEPSGHHRHLLKTSRGDTAKVVIVRSKAGAVLAPCIGQLRAGHLGFPAPLPFNVRDRDHDPYLAHGL
jgi:hypothetical protein